jgi:uncharacterized membrane protein YfhO
MWLDGVILLPLVLLGAEKILRGEKPYLFVVMLVVLCVSNYYIAYMVCVFCAIFIMYRYVTVKIDKGESVKLADFFKVLGKFAGYALLSIGMSLWLVLPSFMDLSAGKLDYQGYSSDTLVNFPFKDYLLSFLPGTYTSITNGGLPVLYCGAVTGILCAAFFIANAVSVKKKLLTLAMFVFLLCSFYFTKLDTAWHAFQSPNWFPYRYAFVFQFFTVYTAAEFFGLVEPKIKSRLLSVVFSAMLLFVCFDGYNNAAALITGLDNQFRYRLASEYKAFREENAPLIEYLRQEDDSFHRIEKTYSYNLNDSLGMGYKGVTHYSSNFNAKLMEFNRSLGLAQNWIWNGYAGSTPLTDSLYDIKYILSKSAMPNDYNRVVFSGEAVVYGNPYDLPIAFFSGGPINHIDLNGYDYFRNQNNLINALCGYDAGCFVPVKYLDVTIPESGMTEFSFTAENDYPIYLSFPAWNNSGGALYINGRYASNYFTGDDNHIHYAGQFDPGAEIIIGFDTDVTELGLLGAYIYYLDMDKLDQATDRLKKGGLYNITYRRSHIEAQVDAPTDGVMFTSIPYDKGFMLKVDGKKAVYGSLNDTFLIFNIDKGSHTVEISFIPQGFIVGLCLSVFSLLFFIAMDQLSILKRIFYNITEGFHATT